LAPDNQKDKVDVKPVLACAHDRDNTAAHRSLLQTRARRRSPENVLIVVIGTVVVLDDVAAMVVLDEVGTVVLLLVDDGTTVVLLDDDSTAVLLDDNGTVVVLNDV
jgi:hypothetical protein